MSTEQITQTLVERLLAGLDVATWDYSVEIDELYVAFPGSAGRKGLWMDADDYWNIHVRLDPETHAPLSITVYPFRAWYAEQTGQGNSLPPEALIDLAEARKHLERVLRASPDLAGR